MKTNETNNFIALTDLILKQIKHNIIFVNAYDWLDPYLTVLCMPTTIPKDWLISHNKANVSCAQKIGLYLSKFWQQDSEGQWTLNFAKKRKKRGNKINEKNEQCVGI